MPHNKPNGSEYAVPLSHPQRRILYTELANPNTSFASLPYVGRFPEPTSTVAIEEAMIGCIKASDCLRTRFLEIEGAVKQYIANDLPNPIETLDFLNRQSDYDAWLERELNRPIALFDGPLYRAAILLLPDGATGYYINVHHAVADGASMAIINTQICQACADITSGRAPAYNIDSFIPFLDQERAYKGSTDFEQDRRYWLRTYENLPEDCNLLAKPAISSSLAANSKRYVLDTALTQAITEIAGAHGVSVFQAFLAGFYLYISRILRRSDVVISTSNHNRGDEKLRTMCGMLVSTLALRLDLDGDPNFAEALQASSSTLKTILKGPQRYPYDLLITELTDREGASVDLMGPTLNYLPLASEPLGPNGPTVQYHHVPYEVAPLLLNLTEFNSNSSEHRIEILASYQTSRYDEPVIDTLVEQYLTLMRDASARPDAPASTLAIMSQGDVTKLLRDFNDTAINVPNDVSFLDLFSQIVEKHPDITAVVCGQATLSYAELETRSRAVASILHRRGVEPDSVVGVMTDRSVDMIVGILAVMRAGAAYMPIDPAYPADRIEYMIGNSNVQLVLTHGVQANVLQQLAAQVDMLDLDDPSLYTTDRRTSVQLPIVGPHNLAYVIYTSGSTGKPKGVMVEHHSLVNLCFWYRDHKGLHPGTGVSKYAAFGFDASVWETFPALMSGAELHIITDDIRLSPKLISEYFDANDVSVAFLPTQFAEHFMEMADNQSLRVLDTGGDKLSRFIPSHFKLINNYGPTEYTVCTTSYVVEGYSDNIPIGKPVYNTRLYILGRHDALQPIGVPGELCISGRGLARGYHNRNDITAERFVDNPYEPGNKMYRTGDLARWLPDGNIEFLGRIDFQVKIRGFRIELGEIENRMMAIAGVNEALVLARDDHSGNKYLCGYYVASVPIPASTMATELAKALPDYMVPPFLLQLEAMPINTHGKVDRNALPAPTGNVNSASEHVPPTTITQKALADIWIDLLNRDSIGLKDDFFLLGGHSLKAAVLQSRIESKLGTSIGLADIFSNSVLEDMAAHCDREQAHAESSVAKANLLSRPRIEPVKPLPIAEYYPMSSGQNGLFILEQKGGLGTTYNVPLWFDIEGVLNARQLAEALNKLVQRHEALRTTFDVIDGVPVQRVHESVSLKKVYKEIFSPDESELEAMFRQFIRPFDLTCAPLMRAMLIKTGELQHSLFLDFHHMAFEGGSLSVLVDELKALYRGETLAPLTVQFRDYAQWQVALLESGGLDTQRDFWKTRFPEEPPLLNMPTDKPRPSKLTYAGDYITANLDIGLSDSLKACCAQNGTTLFMHLLAAYSIVLARYCGQDELVIGTPVAGRRLGGIEGGIGMYVNMLPLRMQPTPDLNFTQYLHKVKDESLAAFEHQEYPFERMSQELNVARDPTRNPLFDVAFALQNNPLALGDVDGFTLRLKPVRNLAAKFDLLMEATETESGIQMVWEYKSELFDKNTIRRFAGHFINVLEDTIAHPTTRIGDLDIISEAEKNQLLYTFNDTDAGYPRSMVLHQLFENAAERFPDRTAVVDGAEAITYAELNTRANQLARHLRSLGASPDSIVGIMTEKDITLIVGILAIMKSGACYLPIKPDFPHERIEYTLENSQAPIVITRPEFYDRLTNYEGTVVDFYDETLYQGNSANLDNVNKPEDRVYVIYTSGSTGKPKGVQLEHRNLVRLFVNSKNPYDFNEHDVWTMFHSFCFDFSVWEMYGALLFGGKLVLLPKEAALDPFIFLNILKKEGVTVLNQTPGAFYNLAQAELQSEDHSLNLRYVIFGGEELKPAMLADFANRYPSTRLINMYGITETTVHVTFKEITQAEIDAKLSNIGVPIPTLTTYIMNNEQKLLPIGVPGELCVGGAGVCRGYIGLPDKNKAAFVPNPYLPGERMYRSGDLAKMLPNGEMEYLGRMDFQVQIRGFRVEIGEIENVLLKDSRITRAVVIALDDDKAGKYLAAYLELTEDMPTMVLRDIVQAHLPEYMVPSYFVKLDKLPLTANGKVDRKALPEPSGEVTSDEVFVAANSETQKKIVHAWQKVLGVEKIGINDNFFALGGHSLKAVTLVAELSKDFKVSVNDIFEFQTVAALAKKIEPREGDLASLLGRLSESADRKRAVAKSLEDDVTIQESLRDYRARYQTITKASVGETLVPEHVLLTGATGYLGAHLLQQLALQGCKHISCLVRGKTQKDATQRLAIRYDYYAGKGAFEALGDRVSVLVGELSSEQLGLDAHAYETLATSVDCIVHSAALVKHYGNYQDFRAANVDAVANLILFAQTHKEKSVHHVSTVSITDGFEATGAHAFFSEEQIDIGQRSENHYARSKLEAETVIEAAREQGLRASIYRIGNITVNSKGGALQFDIENNGFYNQVAAFMNLGAVPATEDEAEFTFVDRVSEALCTLMSRPALLGGNYHLQNDNVVKLSQILTDNRLNTDLDVMEFGAFCQWLYKNYDRPNLRPHIESLLLHRGWLADMEAGNQSPQYGLSFASERTNHILGLMDLHWPQVTPDMLRNLVVSTLASRIDIIGRSRVFEGVSSHILEQLAIMSRQQFYPQETVLTLEGETSERFHLITEGHVELMKHSFDGWLGTLAVLSTGEYLDENPLWAQPSAVTAESLLSEVSTLSWDPEALSSLMSKQPELAMALCRMQSKRVARFQTLMVNMG